MKTSGHQCFHCKQWIAAGVEHDCWTTTEQALTRDLSEDLREAWERLRETAVEFGEQRIYASHHSIMFSRNACHFFVRPKRNRLELVFFLDRPVKSPLVQKVVRSSRAKLAHIVHILHRDQVEAPLTDWLQEAYHLQDAVTKAAPRKPLRKAGKRLARPAKRVTSAARSRSRR